MKYFFLGFLIFGLFACQNKTKQVNNDGSVDSLETKIADTLVYQIKKFSLKAKEFQNQPDSLTKAYVKASYPVFNANEKALNQWINGVVSAEPLKEKGYLGIETAAHNFLTAYENYRREFPESLAGYEWDQDLMVNYQDVDLITFIHVDYAFTGGAHGLQNNIYYNWDKSKNAIITLKDVLVDNYKKPLTTIAEQIFRKNEGLKPNEKLDRYFFENQTFVLNENFLITPTGLQFLYNPYEIKSYAEGTTVLFIPYDKINDLIKADGVLSKYKKI